MEKIFNFDIKAFMSHPHNESDVREEIIHPILKALGYTVNGPNRILREMKLLHPYIQMGTNKKKIYIFPDYILQVNKKCVFVVEVKSTLKNLDNQEYISQAYSYSSHREVNAQKFVLCNGNEFVVYDHMYLEPVLRLHLEEIEPRWNEVYKQLSPDTFLRPHIFNYLPDYGLQCFRLGFTNIEQNFYGAWVGTIARLDMNSFTISLVVQSEGKEFEASFDFDETLYHDFLAQIPSAKRWHVENSLSCAPFSYHTQIKNDSFPVSFTAVLNDKILFNKDEIYIPFKIKNFI